ncbi:MAG: hypothetical protein AB1710_03335 [Pseudomonadota bacterium]
MRARPLHTVPMGVKALLALSLCLQLAWHIGLPPPRADAHALAPPPRKNMLAAAAFGEPIAASQLLALYLQAFDNPPGIRIPFRDLDYDVVMDWLTRMIELDPRGQYPLLLATRLYAQVPDEARQRQMLEFVYREFFADPDRRWPWLAHAAVTAKHRLRDLPLALKYAQAIAKHATGPAVPHWAQQMPIFILEEMGETESARILLGALLANGTVTDPGEIRFLTGRLHDLEQKAVEKSPLPVK